MAKDKVNTPSYISALLQPIPGRGTDRRVWSIPIAGVWQPFFTATNTAGETAIAPEVLGYPLRLQREKDGTPKFSPSGRPVVRVVKELSDQIRMVRDNFVVGLMGYADNVRKSMPNEFKAQVEAAHKAGEPISAQEAKCLQDYLTTTNKAEGQAVAEAERVLATA